MLLSEASLTQLICVIDVRQTVYQLAAHHPLHPVEVEMPKPCVPTPCLRHVAGGETHWMNRREDQLVQPIWGSIYLEEDALVVVVDGEDTASDVDVEPALVELSQAHDAAFQGRMKNTSVNA